MLMALILRDEKCFNATLEPGLTGLSDICVTQMYKRWIKALTKIFMSFSRRVREVWESKKDVLRESGKQVVQQLAEATAAVAPSTELTESSVPAQAVTLCANQVLDCFYL